MFLFNILVGLFLISNILLLSVLDIELDYDEGSELFDSIQEHELLEISSI